MNERNFKTNANEGSDMLRTVNNNYRRAFWIALTTTVVLAIVTLLLWWRLSHTGPLSQPGNSSLSESMDSMAPTSSANSSPSETGSAGDPHPTNIQHTPLPPSHLSPHPLHTL